MVPSKLWPLKCGKLCGISNLSQITFPEMLFITYVLPMFQKTFDIYLFAKILYFSIFQGHYVRNNL